MDRVLNDPTVTAVVIILVIIVVAIVIGVLLRSRAGGRSASSTAQVSQPRPVDVDLARTVHQQATAIRRWLMNERFTEVLIPHLSSAKSVPFIPVFRFESSTDRRTSGSLAVGGAYYLAQLAPEVGRVYSMSSSFRAQEPQGPVSYNTLFEFRYLEMRREGAFEDALAAAESLLTSVITDLVAAPHILPDERITALQQVHPPFPRLTYAQAVERVHGRPGEELTLKQHLELVAAFGSQPVFVTRIPVDVQPRFVDFRLDPGRTTYSFDLIVPFAGEIMTGGELEIDEQVLTKQLTESRFIQELIRQGGSTALLRPYISSIARLGSPHIQVVVGFERVTQFMRGLNRIDQATVFANSAVVPPIDLGAMVPK